MSSSRLILAPNLQLPWSSEREDNKRYWKIFFALFIPFVVLGYLVAVIELPEKTREERAKLPPQLARVVLEKKELPKPKPPEPKKEEPKKEPPKEEKPKPEPKPEPKPKPKPKPEPKPEELKKAKAQAKKVIQTFSDDLNEMRDFLDVSDVKPQQVTRSTGEVAKVDRRLLDSGAQALSGGVTTENLASVNAGGTALSGRETTEVVSQLEEVTAAAEQERETVEAGVKSSRSQASFARTIDSHKSSIFGLYQRALDEDPTLEGRVVFELVVEPDGSVSSVKIISSELGDKRLERRLMARLRGINFGPEDVLQTALRHTVDFLPY